MKTSPLQHQTQAIEQFGDTESSALFAEMGCGKTWIALAMAEALHKRGLIDSIVVLAPKGALHVWREECDKHMDPATFDVLTWTSQPTAAERRAREGFGDFFCILSVLACNTESFPKSKGASYVEAFLRKHRSLFIIDESCDIKNPKASRTKAIIKLAHLAPYRRILDGLPNPNSPLDFFAPCYFLDWRHLGHQSFYSFRGRYAKLENRTTLRCSCKHTVFEHNGGKLKAGNPVGGGVCFLCACESFRGRRYQDIIGYKNLDELQAKLKKFAFRITKAECLDLPPKVFQTRHVEMGEFQAALYRQVRDAGREELEALGMPTADQVLVRITRLHQIVCGAFLDAEILADTLVGSRLEALVAVLRQISGKTVIWATYRENIAQIMASLEEEFGKGSAISYFGDTPQAERAGLIQAFQQGTVPAVESLGDVPRGTLEGPGEILTDGPRFLVGHPRTGGLGVTLTAASHVVYFSNTYNLRLRSQSEDRTHRKGSEIHESVTYIDLVTPGTVDERILEVLKAKKNLSEAVMGEGWREWL